MRIVRAAVLAGAALASEPPGKAEDPVEAGRLDQLLFLVGVVATF